MLSLGAKQVTKRCGRIAAALLLLALFSVAAPGSAVEPTNDSIPAGATTMRGELQALSALPTHNSSVSFSVGAIRPSGDVDYITVNCMGLPLKKIGISNYINDIDMVVYDLAGNFVGQSAGTGPTESVDTSALGRDMLYLKVYGYQGATTSSFNVWFECQ